MKRKGNEMKRKPKKRIKKRKKEPKEGRAVVRPSRARPCGSRWGPPQPHDGCPKSSPSPSRACVTGLEPDPSKTRRTGANRGSWPSLEVVRTLLERSKGASVTSEQSKQRHTLRRVSVASQKGEATNHQSGGRSDGRDDLHNQSVQVVKLGCTTLTRFLQIS